MVADMSDDDIFRLNRGGHDPKKVYAAYHDASKHKGQPTVILAQTVKGYGMGSSGESANPSHQVKLDLESLKRFRDRRYRSAMMTCLMSPTTTPVLTALRASTYKNADRRSVGFSDVDPGKTLG